MSLPDVLGGAVNGILALPLTAQIALGLFLSIAFTFIRLYPLQRATSSIRNVRGPKPSSLFWGNLREIPTAACGVTFNRWVAESGGPTVRYTELLGGQAICTIDPVAAGHILQHAVTFIKPDYRVAMLGRITGQGVLLAEGEAHRRQRKVLNPAFSQSSVRDMMPYFYNKAYQLDRLMAGWIATSERNITPTPPKPIDMVQGTIKMDVNHWLSKLALDVICLAGFGRDFNNLGGQGGALSDAFLTMMSESQKAKPSALLHSFFWWCRWIPSKGIELTHKAKKEADKVAKELVESRKADLESQYDGNIEKTTDVGKDVLSTVLKANMAKDARNDMMLRNDEIEPQIVTFLVAGSETTGTVLSWTLWRLASNQKVQDRLRAELQTLDMEQPELEQLNSLPYLENVVLEGLRMDGAVPAIDREATKDIVIPLGTPIRGRDGSMIDHINFTKGMRVTIPVISINRSTDVWGPDAAEFNPDRFDDKSMPLQHVPGVYGNLISFNSGARNCIGWRLAVAEMKSVLYVLIRNYKFELLPSNPEVEQRANFIMRPRIVGEEDAGAQLPLLVRHVQA